MISIHAPARGATRSEAVIRAPQRFQSTLPQGERPFIRPPERVSRNFNPRSRKGSDGGYGDLYLWSDNFNPRSRKGSDSVEVFPNLQRGLFQSTLPQGERRGCMTTFQFDFGISIHAPARGATGLLNLQVASLIYFNPRSRKGSDGIRIGYIRRRVYFNPRSRKGSDKYQRCGTGRNINFNPRSRKGSDGSLVCLCLGISEFQSTLPQGERPNLNDIIIDNHKFQSTLPQGERLSPPSPYRPGLKFQSTLPQGERRSFRLWLFPDRYFNPRSRKGSDHFSSFLPPA